MPSLNDVPVEVIIDNLLPVISLKDLLSLTRVNKDLSTICSDDTFWKRKVNEDYNFSDSSSARTKGYKFLYRGIHKSHAYVWGESSNGRLGLRDPPLRRGIPILASGVPYPKQLRIPGARLVDIVAGGWSFHGLDSEGDVYVWGTLDTENYALMNDPFSISGKRVPTPVKLKLPERITKISCGRAHSMGLTESNRVLVFTNWGAPYYLGSNMISTFATFTTPLQVECGWSFSAILTRGGEVYVWWPRNGLFGEQLREHDLLLEQKAREGQRIESKNDIVECITWEISADPYLLRDIDEDLPKLRPDAPSDYTKIVKIAAGDNFLIALTKGGHILKTSFPGQHGDFIGPSTARPRWTYLPQFSEAKIISEQPGLQNEIKSANLLHMTHISAHFRSFFAYSIGDSSVVLLGSKDTTVTTPPEIIPGLQNRDIISVVIGDYHFAALTSTGELFTWGQYSSGALGLGDPTKLPIGTPGAYANSRDQSFARLSPPTVSEPTEVKFGTKDYGQGRNVFVFGVTACGWHTGALVIDLDDPEYEEPDEEGEDRPPPPPHGIHEPGTLPGSIYRGRRPFRVGLSGAYRGHDRGRDD